MKILIVRHGDPNYEIDSLTQRGWKEAEYLSQRLCMLDIKAFYCSPLGRAKDTASLTLKKLNRTAVIKDWLREFDPRIDRPDCLEKSIAWDWLPADWTKREAFFDKDEWLNDDIIANSEVAKEIKWVNDGLDEVLANHGYVREGYYYKAIKPNMDTIVFFCHFGLESVLLSHLLNIPLMPLWHGSCAAPSSVTTIVTEERRAQIASFRMLSYGDTSHLYMNGMEPSFSARFCEMYTNEDERHD